MTDAIAPTPPTTLQCFEVWGGNDPVRTSLVAGGLDAWLVARPFAGDAQGGDVYYLSSCATGRITRLLVADVSGHGQHVAAVARELRTLMRRHVNHLDQRRFVGKLNEAFAEQTRAGQFATAVAFTYFGPTDELAVCNAGHPPPLVWRSREHRWELLSEDATDVTIAGADNTPLGILDVADYEQFRTPLVPGDRVLCYTDSVIEARRPDGQMLYTDGLLKLIQRVPGTEPATLLDRLLEALTAEGYSLEGDDLTLLLFAPSPTPRRANFLQRAAAPLVIVGRTIASLLRGTRDAPLPDLRLANIGGAVFGPLSRWQRRA